MGKKRNDMQTFGIMSLVFVAILITLWIIDPEFFVTYLVPWAIFITMIFVATMALVNSKTAKKNASSKKH